MKKTVVSALLACACLFTVACVPASVVRYKTAYYTEGMFRYAYAAQKYLYLSEYKNDGARDTPAAWQTEYLGVTHAERLATYFEEYLKTRLAAASVFEKTGLSDVKKESLEQNVAAATAETFYYLGSDDRDDYEKALAPYGATLKDFERIVLYEYEYRYLYNALFGTNGLNVLSNAEYAENVNNYYHNYYIHVKFAVVSDAERRTTAAEQFPICATDEAFDTFVTTYAENETTEGFFYLYGSYDIPKAVAEALGALSLGENACVTVGETDYYLRRYATDEEYKQSTYDIWFTDFAPGAASYCYRLYLLDVAEEIDFSSLPVLAPWEVKTCKDYNVLDVIRNVLGS